MTKDVGACDRAIAGYGSAEFVYDELRTDDGALRPHWQRVGWVYDRETPDDLARRWRHAKQLVQENGTAYNVFGSPEGQNRPWEIDLLPLVLPPEEWHPLSEGVAQRTRLLSLILADIYGPQALLKERWLPPEIVFAHPHYWHPLQDLPVRPDQRIVLSGTELARSPDGNWWVMADRTEAPAGAGYALENRIVMSSTWPLLIQECQVHRLAPFFMRLQQTLASLSPRATENPRIVLLTEGPSNPYYFEDVYLSRYLGYVLVEGGDLAIRGDRVFIKTLDGLLPVDVLFSRVRDAALDPLELDGSRTQGAAGLLQAVRRNNVAVANAPGSGFVESPVLMAFLPGLCRHLLGEELLIPSIATWWCGGRREQRYVLEHLNQLVIKSAFAHSGGDEIYGNRLSQRELAALSAKIREHPEEYVAQEWVARSSAPVWKENQLQSGHMALRTFTALCDDRYEVMPGALVRVASTPGPMQLSISAGEGSKDLWVLSSGPVKKVSLLPPADAPADLRRSSAQLPSRVADNLYWLGRHLDRVEMTARFVRVIVARLLGENDAREVPELPALLHVLASLNPNLPLASGDSPIMGEPPEAPGIETVLSPLLFDAAEPHSLGHVVSETVRIGSIVRDRLSHDTWRAINRLDEQLFPTGRTQMVPADEALNFLNQLVIDVAVCSGLIGDGMVRGPAWRFLDMGRRIERSLQTCRLIDEIIGENLDPPVEALSALLDVMDSRMTYRSRYLAAVRVVPVLDLLIADETNPRSLAFQAEALARHLDAMPRQRKDVGLNAEQKGIAAALHELRMTDLNSLFHPDGQSHQKSLHSLLVGEHDRISELSDILSRKYLVHSGPAHPFHEERIEPA